MPYTEQQAWEWMLEQCIFVRLITRDGEWECEAEILRPWKVSCMGPDRSRSRVVIECAVKLGWVEPMTEDI